MPSMMRTFEVPVSDGHNVVVRLHEPSLTSDHLGFKTWTSSVLLSRRLTSLQQYLPQSQLRVLELGAGTGLVGIAAACAWGAKVTLTDLPDILPNLQMNTDRNGGVIETVEVIPALCLLIGRMTRTVLWTTTIVIQSFLQPTLCTHPTILRCWLIRCIDGCGEAPRQASWLSCP